MTGQYGQGSGGSKIYLLQLLEGTGLLRSVHGAWLGGRPRRMRIGVEEKGTGGDEGGL